MKSIGGHAVTYCAKPNCFLLKADTGNKWDADDGRNIQKLMALYLQYIFH